MKKFLAIIFFIFTINIVNAQSKHVLVEELTGTWCQYCPGGTHYLDSLSKVYPNVIGVAIHTGDLMGNTSYSSACGLSGAPSANIDRGGQAASIGSWFSYVTTALNNIPSAGINVYTYFNANTRLLTVRVKATFSSAISGNYRLAAIITEDGVTGPSPNYDQSNKYGGGGNGLMGGFEILPSIVPSYMISYNHVGRVLLGGYNGQTGSVPASVNSGDTASYVFTYTIPATWNEDYIKVIGLLIKPDNTIDNAGKSPYLDGNTNAKPLFISPPITIGYIGTPYLFDVYASDPNDDILTITALNLPTWLTLSPKTSLGMIHTKVTLSGTPSATGNYPVKLIVSDGSRNDTLDYTITVNPALNGNWVLAGAQGFTDIKDNLGIVVDNNGVIYTFIAMNGVCNVYQKTASGNWTNCGNLNGTGYLGKIRMGSDGLTPYVAYLNPFGPAMVKKYVSGAWVQIGSNSPPTGVQIGFDLDANDNPYIALEASSGYNGNCYKYDGTSWIKLGNVAYSGSNIAVWNDLVVDKSNSDVYVLWNNYSSGDVPCVSKWNGTAWSNLGGSSVANNMVNYFQNIVLDKNTHQPYVSFARYLGGNTYLDAYKYSGSSWVSIGSDITNGQVDEVSMTINDAGVLMLAFVDYNNSSSVSAMSYSNGIWSYIGPSGFSNGLCSKISIASYQNIPYVLYQDEAASNKATVRYYNFQTGIDEDINIHNTLNIYPNPASTIIYLKEDHFNAMNFNIYDITGRQVLSGKISDNNIDIRDINKGIYFLKIKGNNTSIRLIKN